MTLVNTLWLGAECPISYAGPAGVMGIVNITPDSFFPDSRARDWLDASQRALRLMADGADVIDLGAESSRPGAAPVSARDEIERLLPVIDALRSADTPPVLSVDTYHAHTAATVLEHGVSIINDISACAFDPGLIDVLVQYKPAYVLMHCQGTPATMQKAPCYDNVLDEVTAFFERHMNHLVCAGLPEEHILLDPGIGFGKKMEHNLALMAHPEAWARLGRPSLMALSMKRVFADLLDLPTDRRGPITQTATALTFVKGYTWHRVHDAAAARHALTLASALTH